MKRALCGHPFCLHRSGALISDRDILFAFSYESIRSLRAGARVSVNRMRFTCEEKAFSLSRRVPWPSFPLNLRRDLSPLITLLIARGYCKAQWHSWGRLLASPSSPIPLSFAFTFLFALRLYVCACKARESV